MGTMSHRIKDNQDRDSQELSQMYSSLRLRAQDLFPGFRSPSLAICGDSVWNIALKMISDENKEDAGSSSKFDFRPPGAQKLICVL